MTIKKVAFIVWGVISTLLFIFYMAGGTAVVGFSGAEASTAGAAGGILFALMLSVFQGVVFTAILGIAVLMYAILKATILKRPEDQGE